MSHPFSRRLVYTVAAMLALFTALTSMANASPSGLQRVSASSLNDSFVAKDRFVACPTGKKLLGGGARVLPGNGQVTIDGITLDSPLSGSRARAFEDADGTSLRWAVESFAMCADPLPGLVQVDATSPDNSFDKAIKAQCPVGKQLVGAGVETNGGNGDVAIDDLIPSIVNGTVNVFGIEIGNGTTETGGSRRTRSAPTRSPGWSCVSSRRPAVLQPGRRALLLDRQARARPRRRDHERLRRGRHGRHDAERDPDRRLDRRP